jgi:recombination protein RecR
VSELPECLEQLVRTLTRLPGIGRRSAQRIAFHLARSSPDEVRRVADAVAVLPEKLGPCEVCGNLTDESPCRVCSDPRRDPTLICVVEQPENLAAIERSGSYRGLYHVLGGSISPLRSVGPEDLRMAELGRRLEQGDVREVILATNPTVEGEATALYVARQVVPEDVRVTRPATGLPVGGDLDYIDKSTLSRAFETRHDLR